MPGTMEMLLLRRARLGWTNKVVVNEGACNSVYFALKNPTRNPRTHLRYLISEFPTTRNDSANPALPWKMRWTPQKVAASYPDPPGPTFFYQDRQNLASMQKTVTDVFRDERVEMNYHRASVARIYVERLIVEAMRNGDRHRPTMALADFWLLEKQLVHKLFKVLVPRYINFSESFTALHNAPIDYKQSLQPRGGWPPKWFDRRAVLELKNNPYPDLTTPKPKSKNFLTNVLLEEAKKEFQHDMHRKAKKDHEYDSSKEEST